ncbi:methyltransferase domain protein [Teladorsagia circumcincta]|uniref:Methyltransferase domain protein n=1 Tax=Teladorsagia circumcincta TaxID=45464 RepID=A0A2G9TUF7_TELCI|nr:methyltransferase domain protein [Teladorsagia circumcincta]
MSKVIDEYFGGNFHFAPPRHEKLSLEEALSDLHRKIGQRLGLSAGMSCVDLGCGIGGVMRDLAPTQANLIGITIAPNEVELGNKEFRKLGIDFNCRLMEGDCHNMPLDDGSQDAAYAVYSLKYFPELDGVMKEIVEGLEHACGMPSLHTRAEMMAAAEK